MSRSAILVCAKSRHLFFLSREANALAGRREHDKKETREGVFGRRSGARVHGEVAKRDQKGATEDERGDQKGATEDERGDEKGATQDADYGGTPR